MATVFTLLSLGFVCALLACITKRWNRGGLFDLQERSSAGDIVRVIAIIGTAFLGVSLLFELLRIMVKKLKQKTCINVMILICCIISVLALLSGLCMYARYYTTGGYSLWLLTASTVFATEAMIVNIMQCRRVESVAASASTKIKDKDIAGISQSGRKNKSLG